MQPHLAKFLGNNDSPSQGVLEEVRDLLVKPLQELQNKYAEIKRLDMALNDLMEERDALQKSIDEYATILSPIRRIPSDILHEIFYHCLPTHRNPIMSITEAPLLLTRICHPWRSVALSSHRIWSKLYIPLLPFSAGNYSPVPHPQGGDMTGAWERQRESAEKYARTMRARCKLADIWLSRSGSCPLSISIKFFGGIDRVSADDLDDGHPLLQIFKIVLSFSHRITDLELSMSYEIYEIFQNLTSLDMVPRLRKLRMNLFRRTPRRHGGLQTAKRPVILFQAPNLQDISIYSRNFMAFDPKSIPPIWENLTNLAFHSAITSADAVQVLRRCQSLKHCKFIISDGVDVYISPDEVLSLRHLRSLSLHVGGKDSMVLLYRRIDAPMLDSFSHQSYDRFPVSNPDDSQVSSHPSPFLPLLEKCNGIKKLSFDPQILTAQDVLFSFRFANQLTHLILGQRQHNANGTQYSDDGYYIGPGRFSLDLLILEQNSSPDTDEILLPKLEVFEAYLDTGFSDESLLRFILGRLVDASRNEVSALRVVKVIFSRRREKDVTDEVYQRAKAAGLEIELDLHYFAEPTRLNDSKYTDVFSPWYGLTQSGRSWGFADIDTDNF